MPGRNDWGGEFAMNDLKSCCRFAHLLRWPLEGCLNGCDNLAEVKKQD